MNDCALSRETLEARAAALLELSTRQKDNPLYWYDYASDKIRAFHRSRAAMRILAGGNRSGKSHSGVAEGCAAALGYRPWVLRELGLPPPEHPWVRPGSLPEDAIVFNGAGVRISVPGDLLFVSGLPMKRGIGEVLHPKVKQLIGPFIKQEWMAHGGCPAAVELKNGTKIHYASDEMDSMAFEGTNSTYILIDEPIKKRHYTAIRRGAIDQFARLHMSFTPIGPNAAWVFKDFYQEKDKSRVETFCTSIFDNKFLPPEAVKDFTDDPALSELEKQARLYGRFMHLSDRIYTNFNSDVHVIPPFKVPHHWYLGMVTDPHSIKPWAIAYFAVSPRGDIYFFQEWPVADFTKIRRDSRSCAEYANLLRQLDADLPIYVRFMDPNYATRSETVRGHYIPSLDSEMSRYGLAFDSNINDDLEYGEGKVRQLLAYDATRPVDALNRPRLYFFETCPNLIRAMEFYTFKTVRNSTYNEPDESKRDETYKDFADVVRYVAVKLADQGASDLFDSSRFDDAPSDFTGYGEPD